MIKENVFIYGTGLTARHVYELIRNDTEKRNIIFLNRNYDQYNCVSDVGECWLYTDSRITDMMKNKYTVVVAIMNTQGKIMEVMETLKMQGFKNIIPYAKLADIYPETFRFLYLEDENSFRERMPKINEARKLMCEKGADNRSIEVFDAMVKFRLNKEYGDLPKIDKKEDQYFPRDIAEYTVNNICFVDCGAYVGDTFCLLMKYAEDMGTCVDHYVGIEPDQKNYEQLKNIVENTANIEYTVLPYAASDKEKYLLFDMMGTTASKIEYESKEQKNVVSVKCIPLDSIEFAVSPTHIKMDIEGEERNALLGAKKIIEKYHPKLAICIYHRPEDIYDLMELINSWDLGYKFEMRVYEDVGVDLVLYAV